jgi:hypothetical protein
MSAAAPKFTDVMEASLTSEGRPALPSKTNGPASFLGVIGPSVPAKTSDKEEGMPFGLGVRDRLRPMRGSGCSRCVPRGRLISTGGTVELDIWFGCESVELNGDGDSSIFI